MRAVGVTEFGGPEALHLIDVPEVHAGPGEVRLAVRTAPGAGTTLRLEVPTP